MIDVHAHLTDARYEDIDEVVARAQEGGINKIICSAYDLSSSRKAIELAEKYDCVYATIGIHPENVSDFNVEAIDTLAKMAESKKVVAIGEIGLDYYWKNDDKKEQIEAFVAQIDLANKLNFPIVVHSREAMGDTIKILQEKKVEKEGLLHCYSGSVEGAKILSDLGFSFSFGGVVTFKNAKNAVAVVEFLPIEKIMLETDCPYMSPEPFRGKRNEPKNIVYIADKIARIKNLSIEKVAIETSKNVKRVFSI